MESEEEREAEVFKHSRFHSGCIITQICRITVPLQIINVTCQYLLCIGNIGSV